MARTIGTADSYAGLLDLLRKRSAEIGMTRLELDDAAGLTNGHASKLLSSIPIKGFGPQTLGPVLTALGCRITLEVDEEMLARITKRIAPLAKSRIDASETMLPKRKRNRRGFRGTDAANVMNARRYLVVPEAKRKAIARRAARSRWANKRKAREPNYTVDVTKPKCRRKTDSAATTMVVRMKDVLDDRDD